EFKHEYGISLKTEYDKNYDAVVLAVNHTQYLKYDSAYFKNLMGDAGLLYDVKGVFRGKIEGIKYLSL
ncbi:MAG: nucleotide sugar dehydrogenase, partial [Cyclobacteriaceae bacterium]|nr:nucleotide sugar dehydrogenase [Cyclobacteriaceae bacterium]